MNNGRNPREIKVLPAQEIVARSSHAQAAKEAPRCSESTVVRMAAFLMTLNRSRSVYLKAAGFVMIPKAAGMVNTSSTACARLSRAVVKLMAKWSRIKHPFGGGRVCDTGGKRRLARVLCGCVDARQITVLSRPVVECH